MQFNDLFNEVTEVLNDVNDKLNDWKVSPLNLRLLLEAVKSEFRQIIDTQSDSVTLTLDSVLKRCIETASTKIDNRFLYLAGELELERIRKTLPVSLSVADVVSSVSQLSNTYKSWVYEHTTELNKLIQETRQQMYSPDNPTRPNPYSYFSVETMKRVYFCKDINNNVCELPEYLFLREAYTCAPNKSVASVSETYIVLMNKYATHASPTLFNSATNMQQLSSCFLLSSQDSIDSIYKTLHCGALVSKMGGGLGLSLQNIRSKGSAISTGGFSTGTLPVCKNIESMVMYVSQAQKRRGSCAVYCDIFSKDIYDIARMRLNNGIETERCRELFSAVVVPDIFFQRLREPNSEFTLFCITDVPKLKNLYGKEFTEMYTQYELNSTCNGKKVKTHDLWGALMKSVIETGSPYVLSRSNMQKSPQSGLVDGNILSMSNLCSEIIEYAGESKEGRHTAVCNLGTIKLDRFVHTIDGKLEFNFDLFSRVVRLMIRNLNHTVDQTEYPTECTKRSNLLLRPLGLGIQALADLFMKLRIPFDSPQAAQLNFWISEQMYYSAVQESNKISQTDTPYFYFNRSQTAKGKLQFDYTEGGFRRVIQEGRLGREKWESLKQDVLIHGLRNSLLLAYPPTASTAGMLGSYVESFEPLYLNLYTRTVSSGQFILFNPYLQLRLEELGKFTKREIDQLMLDGGSVQNLQLSLDDKLIFRTAFEQKMKPYIELCSQRQLFCCQSQSMNLFFENPTINKLSSALMYGHKMGLATLMYYCKRRPVVESKQFSMSSASSDKQKIQNPNQEDCLMCGS